MTINTTTRKTNALVGNGNTHTYPFAFKVFTDADVVVKKLEAATSIETTLTLGVSNDYIVTLSADQNSNPGGSITLKSGGNNQNLASGFSIVITSAVEPLQGTDLTNQGGFFPEVINDALDKAVVLHQQQQGELDRSIKFSLTNTIGSLEITENAAARKNRVLGFDNTGEFEVLKELGTYRGNWAASTAYAVRDLVKDTSTNNIFFCNTAHTSSGAQPLTTNTHSANWDLIVDAATATTSATAAATSATAAATSATAAATSATAAATSATSAASSATTATTKATQADTAKTAAETAKTAAETAKTAAETALDSFDDRYLGTKSSNPTLDNDSNALLDGALYFNTSSNIMRVYDLGNTTWLDLNITGSNLTNTNTVAGAITNVNNVGGSIANVNTVATNIGNVNTVAGDIAKVIKVADDLNETVSEIETAANDLNETTSEIDTVANAITNVDNVGNNIANVNTVAGISANVTTVAGNNANVTTVAGSITNVNNVGGSIANVNTCAAGLSGINSFAARYRTDNTGNNPSTSLDAGDLFFNQQSGKLLVYNGTTSAWEETQSVGNFFINTISSFSGTGGNSATFNNSAYKFTLSNAGQFAQQMLVSINGVVQKPNSGSGQPSEGFALDGANIVFSAAPPSGADYFIVTIGASVSIGTPSNNTVSTAILQNDAVNGDKIADDAVGAEHIEVLDAALQFGDSVKAQFGASNDLEIYHSASDSWITDAGTGNLYLSSNGAGINLGKGDPSAFEAMIRTHTDGAVELFYDNSKKLSTLASGIKVERTDATQSYITMATSAGDCGFLYANSNTDIQLMDREGHPFLKGIKDGAVELYWDNAKRLSTWSDSVNIYGDEGADAILHLYADEGDDNADKWRTRVSASSGTFNIENYTSGSWESNIIATGNGAVSLYFNNILTCYTSNGCLAFPDSQAIFMGADNDLQIVHDGSNSIIKDNGTGDLQLRAENFRVQNKEGTSSIIHGNAGAAVELYHNGTKRFETNSTGFGGLGYFNAGPSSNAGNDYHDVRSENNGQWLATYRHATTGNAPYGIWMGYTNSSPDQNGYEFIRFDDSTAQRFRINSDGDIYTHDSGTINSDRTMKENIVDASPKLDDLMKLKVRNFSWKKEFHPAKEGEKKIGFIAQEVEEVFPKLVNESNIAPLGKPDVLKKEVKQAWAPIIIKALQEAVTKIETLEAKVAALESA